MMMEDKKLDELIEATIALADSVDPSGKIAKHADGVPYSHSSTSEEIVDWVLDLYEPIAEAAENERKRLYDLARMIEDGDEIAFDVSAKITKELASEFGEPDDEDE